MSLFKKLCVTSIVLLFAYTISLGCDCVTLSPEEDFRAAESVFVGRVVSIERQHSWTKVTFEVRWSLKGEPSHMISLYQGPTNCDTEFELYRKYVVYAENFGGRLSARACSNTRILDSSPSWSSCHRAGRFELNTPHQFSYSQIAMITFACVGLSISGGFLLPWLVKRRRSPKQ